MEKKVYVVLEYDIEFTHILGIYSTKIKAEKSILKERDLLIDRWKESIEFAKDCEELKNLTQKEINSYIGTYEEFIKNLSGDNWTEWGNGPNTCLRIIERPLL